MSPPWSRLIALLEALPGYLDHHEGRCAEYIQYLAMHPEDFEGLGVVEIWGIQVVAYEDVTKGTLRVLCDDQGCGVPDIETADELLALRDLGRPRGGSGS